MRNLCNAAEMSYEVAGLPFQAHANYGTWSINFTKCYKKYIYTYAPSGAIDVGYNRKEIPLRKQDSKIIVPFTTRKGRKPGKI